MYGISPSKTSQINLGYLSMFLWLILSLSFFLNSFIGKYSCMYTCRQFMCMSVFSDDKTEKESITNLICVYCVLLINMYCEKRNTV